MTSEIRTVIDVGDIGGIEVECRECAARILYPVEKNNERLLQRCPKCNADLFAITRTVGGEGSVSMEQVKLLMRTLKLLAKPDSDLRANIRLQAKCPK